MKKKAKKRFSKIKRSMNNFIKDEDGFVSKENILKIGMGTISALGILGTLTDAYAAHTSSPTHDNGMVQSAYNTNCYTLAHNNHNSHSSHDSY